MIPKVTLLSWTNHPLETVYSVWEASKSKKPLMTPDEVLKTVPRADIEKLFKSVIDQHIPVGEHIDFVFMLENISISWREQAVRHRIGTKASPERLGADFVVDILPDLADSSWWSQSMRIEDQSDFADRRAYRMPETVEQAGPSAVVAYVDAMKAAQHAYKTLVSHGIPMEDAREVMPLGTQHRMSWKLNMSALQHIVGKRGCWILQLGIWGPIIQGMVEELATKVSHVFRDVVTPPCLKGEAFTGCVFHEEVRRRYTGDDKLPPCPLHVAYHVHLLPGDDGSRMASKMTASKLPKPNSLNVINDCDIPMKGSMMLRAEDYRAFWGRDPFTGLKTAR